MTGNKLLFVAAHELSHFFLHTEKIKQGLLGNPIGFLGEPYHGEELMAEVKADFCASLLIGNIKECEVKRNA